jgi:hypothetical protein
MCLVQPLSMDQVMGVRHMQLMFSAVRPSLFHKASLKNVGAMNVSYCKFHATFLASFRRPRTHSQLHLETPLEGNTKNNQRKVCAHLHLSKKKRSKWSKNTSNLVGRLGQRIMFLQQGFRDWRGCSMAALCDDDRRLPVLMTPRRARLFSS